MSDLFARALAEADDETQAEFFNEFAKHLKLCCKGRAETQIHYIADHMDSNGRELCELMRGACLAAVETRAKLETNISDLHQQRHDLEKQIGLMAAQIHAEETA